MGPIPVPRAASYQKPQTAQVAQAPLLQGSVSVNWSPTQVPPSQARRRMRRPAPQLALQAPHDSHAPATGASHSARHGFCLRRHNLLEEDG